MTKEDEGSNSGQQQPENKRKFSQQQYDLLKHCSDKKDMAEWNKWRQEHPDEKIRLQCADLNNAHLEDADLSSADLENANFRNVNLIYANLRHANMENADLRGAYLKNACLRFANLENTFLTDAYLENVSFFSAHLENAYLENAYLENANLREAHLRCAYFWNAKLQGADFSRAIVDGETLFSEDCQVDSNTKFEAVALGNLRIYPKTKHLLEYNIRRMNWEVWYKDNPKTKLFVKPFWLMSDYGRSTGRIVLTFFILAFVFAAIYYVCGMLNPPGIVSSLFEGKEGLVPVWLVPFRTIYFSIVTMTTLGFGDMHANCQSFLGHLLLIVQVILGYVLLGALVTRFAVLFTTGGPAGKFAPIKTKEKAKSEKHKA